MKNQVQLFTQDELIGKTIQEVCHSGNDYGNYGWFNILFTDGTYIRLKAESTDEWSNVQEGNVIISQEECDY